MPSNIAYTWITSDTWWAIDSDIAVEEDRQWPHNAQGQPTPLGSAERISVGILHTKEPQNLDAIVRGLDEPDTEDLAYEIKPNKRYSGIISEQADDSSVDFDYYYLSIDNLNADYYIQVLNNNAPLYEVTAKSPNGSYEVVPETANGHIKRIVPNASGNYYLCVKGFAHLTTSSDISDYSFELIELGNIAKYSDGWHTGGSSQAFWDCYMGILQNLRAQNLNNATLIPYDRGNGVYVYQKVLTYGSQTLQVYVQDLQDHNGVWWQMVYNPNANEAYPLHGQILAWWENNGAEVGYPVGKEMFGNYAGGGLANGQGAVGSAGDGLIIQLFHYTKTNANYYPFNTVCYNVKGTHLGHYAVGRFKEDGPYGAQWFVQKSGPFIETDWPYAGKTAPTGTWWMDIGYYQFFWKDVLGNPQDLVNDQIEEGNSHFGNPGSPSIITPGNLTAVAVSTSQVTLSWNDTMNPSGTTYTVYNITLGSEVVNGVTDHLYTVGNLAIGTGYSFQVSAVYNSVESSLSNNASAITLDDGSSSGGGGSTSVGTLSVFSNVVPSSSASASIDGNTIGSLPILDYLLDVGSHTLTIGAAGYSDYQNTISIVDGQNTSVTGYLSPGSFPMTIQAEGMQHYAPISGDYLQLQGTDQNWYGFTYTDLPQAGRLRVDACLKAGGNIDGVWPKIEMPGYENSVQTVNSTSDTVIVFYKNLSQAITGYEWKIQLDEVTRGINGMMVEVDKLVATYVQPQTNPAIIVSPDTLNLGLNLNGIFSVSNGGDGLLQWAVISEDTTISFDVSSGSNNGDVVVAIDTLGMSIGHFVRPITFSSNAGNIEVFVAWEKVAVPVYPTTVYDFNTLADWTLTAPNTSSSGIENGQLKLEHGEGQSPSEASITSNSTFKDVSVTFTFDNGSTGGTNQQSFVSIGYNPIGAYYMLMFKEDNRSGSGRTIVFIEKAGTGRLWESVDGFELPSGTYTFSLNNGVLKFFHTFNQSIINVTIPNVDTTISGPIKIGTNEETLYLDQVIIANLDSCSSSDNTISDSTSVITALGEWLFDGAIDSSNRKFVNQITGIAATSYGGIASTVDQVGTSNAAVGFDGTGRLVTDITSQMDALTQFTLLLFTRTNVLHAHDQILGRWGNEAHQFIVNWFNDNRFYIYLAQDVNDGGAGSNAYIAVDRDTNWHHYAITYDAGTVQMFYDGVLQQLQVTGSLPTALTSAGSTPLVIGNYDNTTSGPPHIGDVSYFMIDTTVWTDAAISANFEQLSHIAGDLTGEDSTSAPALFGDWSNRVELHLDASMVSGSQDLINFPLLVTEACLPPDIFAQTQVTGIDVQFTLDTLGTQVLPYERVSFGSATAEFHVLVPTIYANQNTTFYVWYGNEYATDTSTNTVWTGLSGVWHMNETSGNAWDSSPNGNTLIDNNLVGSATGKIGNARDFERDVTQFLSISDADQMGLEPSDDWTISFWVNHETVASGGVNDVYVSKFSNTSRSFHIYSETEGDIGASITTGGSYMTKDVSWLPIVGTWYHMVVVYDASAASIQYFSNGQLLGTQTGYGSSVDNSSANFKIGGVDYYNDKLDAVMDEVRVYPYALSADWIATMYDNQCNPAVNIGIDNPLSTDSSTVFGEWHFDGALGTTDKSANEISNGVPVIPINTSSTAGKNGGADESYEFNGTGYLQTGLDDELDGISELTVAMWVKTDATSYDQLFGRWNVGYRQIAGGWHIGNRLNFTLAQDVNDTGGNSNAYATQGFTRDTSWHHIVYVYNGNTNPADRVKIYYDNVALAMTIEGVIPAQLTSVGSSAYQLVLGNIEQSTSGGHVGAMDYATIELVAWSDAKVTANYQQAVAKFGNFAVKTEAPTEYSLEHNYPNPFNPTTTIKYGLPQNEGIQLVVYNVRGQVIKTLVDEYKTAGYHTVSFNANKLASGVYIYKLQAGTFVMTRKMLLIK